MKLSRLRCMLRGNAWCGRHDGFSAIRELHSALIQVKVGVLAPTPYWFFGSSASSAELICRQFVYDRFGGGRLNQALFAYLGCKTPVKLAMPAAWRIHLARNGWLVSRWASAAAWQWIIVLRFVYGILQTFSLCTRLAVSRKPDSVAESYAYFGGLVQGNLPLQSKSEGKSYDICSSYVKWPNGSRPIKAIYHDVEGASDRLAEEVPVRYLPPPYEMACGFASALRLAAWACGAVSFALLKMLSGQWYFALMLGEAAKAKAVRLTKQSAIACEYLFHVSRSIYRPLWTYDMEARGATVSAYFYSTYAHPKLARGYESQLYEWGPNTWQRFYVWDQYQAARMRKDLGESVQLIPVGPVFFSDSDQPIPSLPPNSIAVFDTQPPRPSAHLGISTVADCIAAHPDFYHRFLSDVTEVLRECGVTPVLKAKRDIGGRGDKKYRRILRDLEASAGIRIVSPALSAIRVAAHCIAGISAPFTSTAIHVQSLGIPSIYYDPVGWIQPDDSGAHGIPLVTGKSNLRKWVSEVLLDRREEPDV